MPNSSDLPFTDSEQTFYSEGTACAARVYRPVAQTVGVDVPRPVIVMGHGFGGVRALRLYAYAERFVAAGYLVVVFDYRGFGESEGSPRQVLDVGMQLQDWRAALSFARALPGADPERLIAWGTSFGGGHVITLAGRARGWRRSSRRSLMSAVPQQCAPLDWLLVFGSSGSESAIRSRRCWADRLCTSTLSASPAAPRS
jgi:pimeloyl-ACP methyl ester carboxylesterase